MARQVLLGVAVALLAGCGGGGGDAPAPVVLVAQAATASTVRGTPLSGAWSAYPRMVRLAHQADPARNGRIVASLTERVGSQWQAGFHASDDGGTTFSRLATLTDGAFANGMCCGTLFEVPQTVGAIAAGTLLYAASVGADTAGTLMEQPIYRSTDAGSTFTRLDAATCGRSLRPRGSPTGGSGIWEPEFLVAADGSLACIYSDETALDKSQVLRETNTLDGVTWTAPRTVLSGPLPTDRPGMAGVRRLANGRYLMSFESCSAAHLDCAVRLVLSDDGLDWGAPGTLGSRPQTASGLFFRHAPTIAWSQEGGGPDGTIFLIGQSLTNAGGQAADAGNGRTVLRNTTADASGDWRMASTPIGLTIPAAETDWCKNYSTPLLPSVDGKSIALIQTDSTAGGGCDARFGQGSF